MNIILKGVKYEKDQKFEYAYDYTLNNKDVDVVFLSNSYIFTGFDPLYLEGLTGLKSVHLGHHGMSILYDYVNAFNTLEQFSPKYIVLDVSPPSLNSRLPDTDKIKYYAQKSLIHSDLSIPKLATMWDLEMYNDLKFSMKSLSPFTASLVDIKSVKYSNFFQNEFQNESSYLGFQPLNNKKKKKEKSWENFNKVFLNNPVDKDPFFIENSLAKEYLFKIIDYANEKGTEVILINSLKFAPTRGLHELDSLLHKNNYSNVHIFDMNDKREFTKFYKEDFSDISHLNHSGALKQTKVFANYMHETILKKTIISHPVELENYKIKSFNFVADNNGGFYSQIVMDSTHSGKIKYKGVKVLYHLKNNKKDSITSTKDSWVSVGNDMIYTFKTPSKYLKTDIDSIEISEAIYKPLRVKALSKEELSKDCFKISKILNNKFKFEFNIEDGDQYEYVIYRYLDSKIIDPVHTYGVNNFMEFEAIKPIDQYRFDCFYRAKTSKNKRKRIY